MEVDIITIESEIFQRRSKNMMAIRAINPAAAGKAMMKTVNLIITHSTRLEWIA